MTTTTAQGIRVGTLVGESTSREFTLALAEDAVREQDIIAVDGELRATDGSEAVQQVRIWAKVQRVERINPLFPTEAGHELAATRADPFDTVLSLSREMVSAVCQVLGSERIDQPSGRLDRMRYPAKPASTAYAPASADIARIVVGDLTSKEKRNRALDIAHLANRPDVDVLIDGHAVVTRHLAVLAMTGAGKSVTVRRIVEQLATKNYPIVIFDPHGDYTGLADVEALRGRVQRYYAHFPIFDEDSDTIAHIVGTLGYSLSETMAARFPDLFDAARKFWSDDRDERQERNAWLAAMLGRNLNEYAPERDLWLVADLAEAAQTALQDEKDNPAPKHQLQEWCWEAFGGYTKNDARTLDAIKKRVRRAASALQRMQRTNQKISRAATPLPLDRRELVQYGRISVVSLAGYTGDVQATLYSIVVGSIFGARVDDSLALPALLVLEEAHNFAPGHADSDAEKRAVEITRQIAQEGRKFGVGLVLISQRPSRLDETTLSQCNSHVIMRLVNPADQRFVRAVVESLTDEEARMLPDLDVGEAILAGQMVRFPVLVRIKEPASQGEHEEEDAFAALEEARVKAQQTNGYQPPRRR